MPRGCSDGERVESESNVRDDPFWIYRTLIHCLVSRFNYHIFLPLVVRERSAGFTSLSLFFCFHLWVVFWQLEIPLPQNGMKKDLWGDKPGGESRF